MAAACAVTFHYPWEAVFPAGGLLRKVTLRRVAGTDKAQTELPAAGARSERHWSINMPTSPPRTKNFTLNSQRFTEMPVTSEVT